MISRRTRRRVAQLALGALLFAQATLVATACDWEQAAPARAIVSKSIAQPCHEEPATNANLCLAHCLSTDQSAGTAQFSVPIWVDSAPLVVAAAELWRGRALIIQFVLPRPAAPPPRILFQSFLI